MAKHLIISGGGQHGFTFWGVLQELHCAKQWSYESLQSVHGTSVGGILAALLCTKVDFNTISKYLIQRPWHQAYRISFQQVAEGYKNRGILGWEPMLTLFKPLLRLNGWDDMITLKQLYEATQIHLCLTVVDLNAMAVETMSYLSHPDVPLVRALTATCAIPGLVQPMIYQNKCYVDGGLMCNYPWPQFVQLYPQEQDQRAAIGVRLRVISKPTNINDNSTLVDLLLKVFVSTQTQDKDKTQEGKDKTQEQDGKNHVYCCDVSDGISIQGMLAALYSAEVRAAMVETGSALARTGPLLTEE